MDNNAKQHGIFSVIDGGLSQPKTKKTGSGGGSMEARVAKLESDVEYIKRDIGEIKDDIKDIKKDAKSDFRMLFGAIIAVALGLAGLMAKGFGWL